jgi:F-type H+-transporting ATPase subunit a
MARAKENLESRGNPKDEIATTAGGTPPCGTLAQGRPNSLRIKPLTSGGAPWLPTGTVSALETSALIDFMRRSQPKLALLVLFVGLALSGSWAWAGDAKANPALAEAAVTPQKEEHRLPQKALEIARPFGFPITNSMLVTWAVAAGLIIFAQAATRRMERIPSGAQNFLEWLVESLAAFLEGIIGRHLVQRTFWFFASVFIFILCANWAGLIPGIGSIGWKVQFADGHSEWCPLLRGANADLNLTLAMALVFFACWIVWALREVGPMGFAKELFGPKGENTGFLKALMIAVFFAAGCLELISILFRPVSLSFRLYGNIFAGENMLETMAKLVPGFGWLLPIPFYFLELLVGLVQALVFMLLTAVFTLLICQHEEAEPATAGQHG